MDKELKDCKFCGVKVAWTTNKAGKGYFCNVYPSNNEYKRHAGISVAYTHVFHKCNPTTREEYRELMGDRHPDNKVDAPAQDKKDVPEGRNVITGSIVSIKDVDGAYGMTAKVLIQCDGYRVYGTLPTSLDTAQAVQGTYVTLTATIKRSDKDSSFGFYSRPTKASFI